VGYTVRATKRTTGLERMVRAIRIPSLAEIKAAFDDLRLSSAHVIDEHAKPTDFGRSLVDYFDYRATVLNTFVEPRLMNVTRVRPLFKELRAKLTPKCPLPMNKQKGKKKTPAYLTGIVNMLIESNSKGLPCDYDPRELTTVTQAGVPLRTLARRIDGAFPSPINPIAVWEIKEYYYTTTFGSRVADGVYETLLDGMEIEELREHEGIDIKHVLMIDDHFTWWDCGRSYLCRIVDMLHMGYVDEVLFGYEVIEELPSIVKEWVKLAKDHKQSVR
jgi:hypothetical protein